MATPATVHAEMACLYEALAAKHRELAQAEPKPISAPDELLRIKEACKRAKWSYSWAVKHWAEVGGFKDLDGALKIRTSVLARHCLTG